MFDFSKRFYDFFCKIYEANCNNLNMNKEFDEVFKNNASRMEYIISLFDELDKNNLSFSGRMVFEETIEYIVGFINGIKKVEI